LIRVFAFFFFFLLTAASFQVLLGCGGAAGFVVLFEDVVTRGLDQLVVLGRDEDTILSMAAADFDCDGQEELLVGTFGGRLLIYGRDNDREWKGWFSKCFFFFFFFLFFNEIPEKTREEFGLPLHSFHVLRSADVIPYVLCGTPASLDVLGPPLRSLEAILEARLDAIVEKYSH
jgi:hypothetical protein